MMTGVIQYNYFECHLATHLSLLSPSPILWVCETWALNILTEVVDQALRQTQQIVADSATQWVSFHLVILALLILPSAYVSLRHLTIEFFITLYLFNILCVKRLARHFISLIGEALISHIAKDLLERVVSSFPPPPHPETLADCVPCSGYFCGGIMSRGSIDVDGSRGVGPHVHTTFDHHSL